MHACMALTVAIRKHGRTLLWCDGEETVLGQVAGLERVLAPGSSALVGVDAERELLPRLLDVLLGRRVAEAENLPGLDDFGAILMVPDGEDATDFVVDRRVGHGIK